MPDQPKQHVLVSGASGLVGSAVVDALSTEGHRVTRLVRKSSSSGAGSVAWGADDSELRALLANSPVDVVIHLAGTPIFALWTELYKKEIRDSRVLGTKRLATALASAAQKPTVMICASAVGYYGNRADEVLTEESGSGSGFLAQACVDWEVASQPAHDAGIRVANVRIGIVLAAHGGALKQMLPSFKLGLGARLGSGQQWMSWIALEDLVRVIQFVIAHPQLRGAINSVAPQPVTNRDFTATLAKVLKRPAFLSVPEFVLRMAPGGMGEEALLASARVVPERLAASEFSFKYPELEQALSTVLAK